MELSVGDVVDGKYRIEGRVGVGGMGTVYVATHGVLKQRVALKVMAARFRVDAEAVERFFREAVAASKVKHPAVVQLYDAGDHEGAPWMTMELLEGESLEARVEREGKLGVQATLQMARPILSGLAAVHRVGVVHRDIKPDNIFLARSDRAGDVPLPKLLDFGIAKHLDDPDFDRLTATGSVLGTPLYLSPEQARGQRDIDARTDLFSFGVMLYRCLSGTTPHTARTFPELIAKLLGEPPRPLSDLEPELPKALCDCVHRCMEHDRAKRPQTADELLQVLQDATTEKNPAPPMAFEPTRQAPARQPPPPSVPATAVAVRPQHTAQRPPVVDAWTEAGTDELAPPRRRSSGTTLAVVIGVLALGAGGAWLGLGGALSPTPSPPTVERTSEPPAPADPTAVTPVRAADPPEPIEPTAEHAESSVIERVLTDDSPAEDDLMALMRESIRRDVEERSKTPRPRPEDRSPIPPHTSRVDERMNVAVWDEPMATPAQRAEIVGMLRRSTAVRACDRQAVEGGFAGGLTFLIDDRRVPLRSIYLGQHTSSREALDVGNCYWRAVGRIRWPQYPTNVQVTFGWPI